MMEGFSFVTRVTGLNRPNTGNEDEHHDDDEDGLFNDAVICTKNMASYNGCLYWRIMNWKGCERKRSWLNLSYYPGDCLD
jgi:hypothetical protein